MAKTVDKWTETRNLLLRQGLRRPVFGLTRPTLFLDEIDREVQKLIHVLNEISAGDPRVFSFALQSFLSFMSIDWPDGVFKHDFSVPSRGRPLSWLSVDSWHMYIKNGYGWRRVAKDLIPEQYSKDPDEAAKKVRKAAASFKGFRRSVECSIFSSSERIQDLLDEIVWVDGLREISSRVVYRTAMAACEDQPERLQLVNTSAVDEDRWKPIDMTGVRNKWTEARNLLLRHALRKPVIRAPGQRFCLNELEGDIRKLVIALNEVSASDSRVFSFSLQSFLAFIGVRWPDGVFKYDFAVPSRGRPLPRLSIDSWLLNVRYGYGWRSVAKDLVPEEYAKDPIQAVKKVRKAAATLDGFRRSVEYFVLSRSKRVRKLLDQIVWFEGLEEIVNRVVNRKCEAALRGRPIRLPGV